ncbi:hypothetical protein [Yoonia sp.]|uniref:hypothetical protein n=1 Tax=Yoonia sp. TaxID=2212373 RepID=UPI00345BD962
MADAYVDKVANELADLALADQKASGDIGIVDMIGEVLGASSQTLQESYLTAVRVRRAEERAREILAQRAASGYAPPPKPKPAPLQHAGDAPAADAPAPQDAAPQGPPMSKPSHPDAPAPNMPRRVTR